MNEHVKKWIAALRSGQYKQGHGQLRAGDRFCCLGVACDLVDPAGWELAQADYTVYFHTGAIDYTPSNVATLYDFPATLEATVAGLNDNGATFPEIADYIESVYVAT